MNLENMLSEDANLKGPHIVWFKLYEMSRKGESKETETLLDRLV